ncbi:MAG: DUF1566 domain-containing protein [Bacteroidetes bacterium]|nr:DUF1566 domain-containing protein [Bacteroidota bacterium]
MKSLQFYFFMIVFSIITFTSLAQVGINADNSQPSVSAMLDVKSDSKGFLPPRMTTEQMNAIFLPTDGLLVYNITVNSLYWYNGSTWKRFNEMNFTESDPIFGESIAAGITSEFTNNWNSAYANRITLATGTFPLTLTIANNQLTGSIAVANSFASGYLTSTDWNAFYNKVSSQWTTTGSNISFNSGNVGIGTTAPGQKFSVAGTIQTTSGGVKFPDGTLQTTAANNIHTIGENFGGGVVFFVYDNGKHGLIASTTDQSTAIQWYNGTYRITGTSGDGLGAGSGNTDVIVAAQMADNQYGEFAAKVCADYSVTVDGITYGDWYLPSKYELNFLFQQKVVVGGFANSDYWSSTESSANNGWSQYFYDGFQSDYSKNGAAYVRAIRAF